MPLLLEDTADKKSVKRQNAPYSLICMYISLHCWTKIDTAAGTTQTELFMFYILDSHYSQNTMDWIQTSHEHRRKLVQEHPALLSQQSPALFPSLSYRDQGSSGMRVELNVKGVKVGPGVKKFENH